MALDLELDCDLIKWNLQKTKHLALQKSEKAYLAAEQAQHVLAHPQELEYLQQAAHFLHQVNFIQEQLSKINCHSLEHEIQHLTNRWQQIYDQQRIAEENIKKMSKVQLQPNNPSELSTKSFLTQFNFYKRINGQEQRQTNPNKPCKIK